MTPYPDRLPGSEIGTSAANAPRTSGGSSVCGRRPRYFAAGGSCSSAGPRLSSTTGPAIRSSTSFGHAEERAASIITSTPCQRTSPPKNTTYLHDLERCGPSGLKIAVLAALVTRKTLLCPASRIAHETRSGVTATRALDQRY